MAKAEAAICKIRMHDCATFRYMGERYEAIQINAQKITSKDKWGCKGIPEVYYTLLAYNIEEHKVYIIDAIEDQLEDLEIVENLHFGSLSQLMEWILSFPGLVTVLGVGISVNLKRQADFHLFEREIKSLNYLYLQAGKRYYEVVLPYEEFGTVRKTNLGLMTMRPVSKEYATNVAEITKMKYYPINKPVIPAELTDERFKEYVWREKKIGKTKKVGVFGLDLGEVIIYDLFDKDRVYTYRNGLKYVEPKSGITAVGTVL